MNLHGAVEEGNSKNREDIGAQVEEFELHQY